MTRSNIAAVTDDSPERTSRNTLFEKNPELTTSLRYIAQRTRAFMVAKLKDVGLEAGQDQFIQILPFDGTLSVKDVADTLSIRPSTVSKMTDRLFAAGLVQRVSNLSDRRRTHIELTELGAAKKLQVEKLIMEIEKELISGLGDCVAEVTSTIEQVDQALTKRLRRLR